MEKRQAEAAHFATAENRHRQVSWWFGVLRLLLFAFGMFAVVQTFRDNANWVLRGVVPSAVVFVLVVIWHRRIQRRQETARRSKLLAQESAARLRGGSGPGASTSIPRQPLSDLDAGGIVMLSDIRLLEGVEIPALAGDEVSDTMIANAVHIKESQGTGVAAAEEAAALEAELGEIVEDDVELAEEGEEGEEGEVAADEAVDDSEAEKE